VTRYLIAIASLLLLTPAFAIDQDKRFDDPKMQARYEQLISEVRCLQCQNQSIKDSNVTLAADLRREIARMIDEGLSDEEIAEFLVTRYGEFALYRPRSSGKMIILWIVPFLLVVLGGVALIRVIRHRASLPIGEESEEGQAN
jgi:cytochrome c-type biogenesis protein CcmH